MRALLAIVAVFLATACGRHGRSSPEPTAEPAPVEIDWPDAAVAPPRAAAVDAR